MPRAGAVVVVLLAALLHVLACSHGPTVAPVLRADSLLQASAAACGQQLPDRHREATAGQSTPAPDKGAHCRDLDEPTTQPLRDPGPAEPPLPVALPFEFPDTHQAIPSPALHQSRPQSTASPAGRTRALLGVWRT